MTERRRETAHCLALHADIQPAEYILTSAICELGRAPECQIIVPHSVVSRLHARIERDGPRYMLTDLNSANGTFVNQRRILAPHRLKNRDAIGLGSPAPMIRFIDPDPTFEPVAQLRYDERAMQFLVGQQPVDLTPTQIRLLVYLYQHAGSVCTRESCMEAIWGPHYDRDMDSQVLDGVVSAIRRKFREVDPDADYVKTRRGLGYELEF
jgi:DNA-binding response OmpR family regulator